MKLFRSLMILAVVALALKAQPPPVPTQAYYVFTLDTTLAGGAGVFSVGAPATPSKTAVFVKCTVSCPPSACKFTFERDNGALGASAGAIARYNPSNAVSTLLPYVVSTATGGTTLATYSLPLGGVQDVDVTGLIFQTYQSGRSVTIRTTSMTGEVILTLKWYEQ
jgi:hypothetical protein